MDESDPVLDPSLGAFEKAARRLRVLHGHVGQGWSVRPGREPRVPVPGRSGALHRGRGDGRRSRSSRSRTCCSFRRRPIGSIVPPDPADETAKPVKYGPSVMRRTKHFPYFGFARLHVHEGRVERGAAPRSTRHHARVQRIGAVSGDFQIIVEMGAEDPDEVCARLQALGEVPGVTNVEAGRSRASSTTTAQGKRPVGRARGRRPSPAVRRGPPPATDSRTDRSRSRTGRGPARSSRARSFWPPSAKHLGQRQRRPRGLPAGLDLREARERALEAVDGPFAFIRRPCRQGLEPIREAGEGKELGFLGVFTGCVHDARHLVPGLLFGDDLASRLEDDASRVPVPQRVGQDRAPPGLVEGAPPSQEQAISRPRARPRDVPPRPPTT